MTTRLRRFCQPINAARLAQVILDPEGEPSEDLGVGVDLGGCHSTFERLLAAAESIPKSQRSAWDAQFLEPLHRALRFLPGRVTADMRLWHWMSVREFPRFVWYRWHGQVPQDPSEVLTPSLAARFLGTNTLHGVSRNALARLYWCAETLHSPDDDYGLAKEVLDNQDFFQAIFEREFGLYPPAVRACLAVLRHATEEERRDAIRRLNHHLTTVVLETLDETDLRHLIALR